jgi:hypothetical protein
MGILGRSGVRMMTRSAGDTLLVKALSVILTVFRQHIEDSNATAFVDLEQDIARRRDP